MAPFEANSEGVQEAAQVDRISDLPVHIIHRILNLATDRDGTKTSVLSRKWQDIWESRPDIYFAESTFGVDGLSDERDREKRDALFAHMEKTLERRSTSEYCSAVSTVLLSMTVENASSELLVKRWIDFALKNRAERLFLDILVPDHLHLNVFDTTFSSATLFDLTMRRCDITNCSFVLPNLRGLCLSHVGIEDDCFKDLLAQSPLLQALSITSLEFPSTIVVSNPALDYLRIVSCNGKILVESPVLESVEIELPSEGICKVEITSTTTVKNLTLGDVPRGERALIDLVNRCPLLENLEIHGPYLPDDMSLSHQHLKSIVLQIFDSNYRIIRMDAPKLKYLEYFGGTPPLFCMKVSSDLDSVKVHLAESDNFGSQWYIRLRKILEAFAHSKHLTLICENEKAIIFPDELTETLGKINNTLSQNLCINPSPPFIKTMANQNSPNLECRMYEARFPEIDTPVMIQIKSINPDVCAYVSLLEYNNIEGMLSFTELSRRRIRSVASLVRIGRVEPVMVLHVDAEKGYVNLSKRRVSEEDAEACEERYSKSKHVHSIMRHVAETANIDLEDLYIHVGWPLYRKYGHAFEAFKLLVSDDSVLDSLTREVKEIGPDGEEVTKVVPAVSAEVKDELIKNIKRRMTPQTMKIRADVELKCFQFDGVLHIKEAMRKAEAAGNDECPVKMSLIGPPLYVLNTQTLDKEQGISILNKAIAACTEEIERHNGKLVVKEAPRAVSEREDKLLAAEHMDKSNEEDSGDEDSEEEDEGMGTFEVV